jgi:hypothetical protein
VERIGNSKSGSTVNALWSGTSSVPASARRNEGFPRYELFGVVIGAPISDLFLSIGIGAIGISPGSVEIGAGDTRGLGHSPLRGEQLPGPPFEK